MSIVSQVWILWVHYFQTIANMFCKEKWTKEAVITIMQYIYCTQIGISLYINAMIWVNWVLKLWMPALSHLRFACEFVKKYLNYYIQSKYLRVEGTCCCCRTIVVVEGSIQNKPCNLQVNKKKCFVYLCFNIRNSKTKHPENCSTSWISDEVSIVPKIPANCGSHFTDKTCIWKEERF